MWSISIALVRDRENAKLRGVTAWRFPGCGPDQVSFVLKRKPEIAARFLRLDPGTNAS